MNENVLQLGYLILRVAREKDRKESGESDINQRVYMLHMDGEVSLEVEENSAGQTYGKDGRINKQLSPPSNDRPEWAKKIEREILKKTHPDKNRNKTPAEIKEKTEMFYRSKKAVEEERYVDLLPIALTLGINFTNFGDTFEKDIEKRIKQIQQEITDIQSSVGWRWHDYSEDQKIQAIDIILKRSGIKRSKKDIKEAVNKRIKRPIGTRPRPFRELRNQK